MKCWFCDNLTIVKRDLGNNLFQYVCEEHKKLEEDFDIEIYGYVNPNFISMKD